MMDRAWVVAKAPERGVSELLEREATLPGPIARLIVRRGVSTPREAAEFFAPDLSHLADPFGLRDMTPAVDRLSRALDEGEGILVHGDYDVDGTTATALLVRVLRGMGGRVDYYIPHRLADGYGLSQKAIDRAKDIGASIILTADCGIGAIEPVRAATAQGIDTVITDHHSVGEELPEAIAVINPKRSDCTFGFKDFAGVGVAFKLLEGLARHRGNRDTDLLADNLDLVALGTIADVVPLRGENRVLAWLGLKQLGMSKKIGLSALLESSGLQGRRIDSGHIAFVLAPRINAAGRLGDSITGVELLLSGDETVARELAEQLEENNRNRRKLNETMLEEAMEMVGERTDGNAEPIVLWSDEWHSGVLGIVAAKLVERYRVPTVLIALDGGEGRGSGRSVSGFDMVGALAGCSHLLVEWGGHKYAVGLTVGAERLEEFRDAFVRQSAAALDELDLRPTLDIEERVPLGACDRALAVHCERLAPFGYENPEPLFMAERLQLSEAPQRLGDRGQHLRITAYQDGHTAECIGFGMGDWADKITEPGQTFSLAFVPTINRWRGRETVQLKVKDIKTDL